MKQFYLEVLVPLYEGMGSWELAIKYIETMGYHAGIENMIEYLPEVEEAQRKEQEQKIMEQKALQDEMENPNERERLEMEAQQSAGVQL
jgi:hypothetical protein